MRYAIFEDVAYQSTAPRLRGDGVEYVTLERPDLANPRTVRADLVTWTGEAQYRATLPVQESTVPDMAPAVEVDAVEADTVEVKPEPPLPHPPPPRRKSRRKGAA